MRLDEDGDEAPETLGEYRDLCEALGGPDCQAVRFLNEKITQNPGGEDEKVIAPDSQMRALLIPLMVAAESFLDKRRR